MRLGFDPDRLQSVAFRARTLHDERAVEMLAALCGEQDARSLQGREQGVNQGGGGVRAGAFADAPADHFGGGAADDEDLPAVRCAAGINSATATPASARMRERILSDMVFSLFGYAPRPAPGGCPLRAEAGYQAQ